jgi:hypothetical protein
MTSRSVARSLYTGMTTESCMSTETVTARDGEVKITQEWPGSFRRKMA